jgi:hypothetical protein
LIQRLKISKKPFSKSPASWEFPHHQAWDLYLLCSLCQQSPPQRITRNHIAENNAFGSVEQILNGKEKVYKLTPDILHAFILVAMGKYQQDLFLVCEVQPVNKWQVTPGVTDKKVK